MTNTHLKHSKPYTFSLQKVKKPPDGFCTNIVFASETILIVGGLFLHKISRPLKANIKWIRVPRTEFKRQKYIDRRGNKNSSKSRWNARKKPPKGHTKNIPLLKCTI